MDTRVPLELMPDSSSAGSYGPEENSTPAFGAGFDVPYLTVDEKGRISSASTKRITLPSASEASTVAWQNVTDKPTSFTPSNHASTSTEYGASSATHYGHALASTTTPLSAASTAFVGIETSSFARGDHVHPEQTSVSGNAGTATKLETTRNISLTGDASGTASFDGSQNISISVSTIKEVAYTTSEPDASNATSLDNESIIFYADTSGGTSSSFHPVYTTGNQTVGGVKTFSSGIFRNAIVLDSSTSTIDASQASCFVKTITAATAFSFASVPSGVFCSMIVVLNNGGGYFIVWPPSVKWSGNETPDLAVNGTDVLQFMTFDGGTNWFGSIICSGLS